MNMLYSISFGPDVLSEHSHIEIESVLIKQLIHQKVMQQAIMGIRTREDLIWKGGCTITHRERTKPVQRGLTIARGGVIGRAVAGRDRV